MSLSSEAKKYLHESLQQQCLNQNSAEYGEAKKLLSGLTDLNYKPGHGEHRHFEYLLPSNARGELTSEDNTKNIALLEAYHPEEINSQYIIRVAGKGFTAIDHPSEIYKIPDAHECIDGNQPLRPILDIDARQKPDPTNPELPSLVAKKLLTKI